MDALPELLETIEDGVATLTFNRPERLNALSTPIMQGLLDGLPRLAGDPAVKVVVLTGNRAGEVIGRIRALVRKAPPRKDEVAINDAILEVVALTRGEAVKNGVSVQTELAQGLPLVQGDRVQLQQVILNLIINAVEAMSGVSEGARRISTRDAKPGGVLVAIRDSGPGLLPADLDRLFEAFYTTKPDGLGIGLSICRSIIETHGGRLWVTANAPQGAVFQLMLPTEPDAAP